MKKTSKILAALLALCMVVAFAACTQAPASSAPVADASSAPAESSPESAPAESQAATDADALVATATSNLQAAEGMSYIMNMVMDMEVMGQPMNMTMDSTISMVNDPLQLSMVMDVDAAGQAMQMEMYAVQNGDTVTMYLKSGDEWTEQTMTLDQVMDQAGGDTAVNNLEGLEDMQIVGDETVAGIDCVKITGVVTGAAAQDSLNQSGGLDQFADSGVDMAALLADISVPTTVWISKDSGDLIRMEADMTETMASIYETILGSVDTSELEGQDVSINVNKVLMTMEYTAFEGVSVPVPAGIAA